jgi:hypothetical protein
MYTIEQRTQAVIDMIGGRTDQNNNIYSWLGYAYTEIGMSYDFEELEETTTTALDGNNSNNSYPYPTIVDSNNNNWTTRAVKSLVIVESNNSNNNLMIHLSHKPIQFFDRLPNVVGRPAIYTKFKQNVILHPAPSNSYDGWLLRWRVWRKPFLLAGNNLNSTEIYLPDDWVEILDYAAALRAHTRLLERDKAAEIMQLLHGSEDPRRGRRVPGLIEQKLLQRHAESQYMDWGIRPRQRGYTK